MTTENSVRVPREALEFWERMLADGSTTTSSGLPVTVLEMIDVNQAIASEMRKHLAAPAPAGSLPEQGAGLANAVYATVREALACDCNDTEDQVCDKCQALTAIIYLEERALARQQPQGEQGAGLPDDLGTDEECQLSREMHFRIDSILMEANAFELMHEGDEQEAWLNTVEAVERLARQQSRVVDAAMVERALDCQPFTGRNSSVRFWQLFLDERDAKAATGFALRAALEGGRDGR